MVTWSSEDEGEVETFGEYIQSSAPTASKNRSWRAVHPGASISLDGMEERNQQGAAQADVRPTYGSPTSNSKKAATISTCPPTTTYLLQRLLKLENNL